MNYLSHARDLLDRPWALVGAALPDWLRILDRRVRLRPDALPPEAPDADPVDREIRDGIRIHHEDDLWFHRADGFRRETAALAREIRGAFPDRPKRRMRASFYSHILLEMLLDSALMERHPDAIGAYYAALDSIPIEEMIRRVRTFAPAVDGDLARLARGFRESRFLARYDSDAEITHRLDQVGRRMRQPPLPPGFDRVVAAARVEIRAHAVELLTPDAGGSSSGARAPAAR